MKAAFLLPPLFVLLAACGRTPEPSVAPPAPQGLSIPAGAEAETVRAKEAVAAFGAELRAKLTSAIAEGGAVGAIEVCSKVAPELAKAHGEKSGVTIRRATTRMRNPDNESDDWEIDTLASFAARMRDGATVQELETAETTTLDGQPVLRYAKVIVIEPVCLTCHGTTIAPPIAQKLRDLYPDDKAIGYQAGDLRALFSVVVPMAKTGAN